MQDLSPILATLSQDVASLTEAASANATEITALNSSLAQCSTKISFYQKEIVLQYVRSLTLYCEVVPPTADAVLNLQALLLEDLVNERYLTRLHSAYSNAGKTLVIHCDNGEA